MAVVWVMRKVVLMLGHMKKRMMGMVVRMINVLVGLVRRVAMRTRRMALSRHDRVIQKVVQPCSRSNARNRVSLIAFVVTICGW